MPRCRRAKTPSMLPQHFQTMVSKSGTDIGAALSNRMTNQYWFSASATEPAKKIGVSVYDETGKQVTTEGYDNGERAAAGFAPSSSGQYFVSIDLVEGEQGTFCLVYSYK